MSPVESSLKAALESHRRLVDEALAGCFDGIEPAPLRDATRWYPDAGGKRLRPVMALLACEAAGGTPQDALPVALAVELVHNFSLVHDDIMDRDDTRRGRPTVHRKWDEPMAILAGDVLFARAFEVLARIPAPAAHQEASRLLSAAIRRLCEGQAMDVLFERQPAVQAQDYLRMIHGKTAVLFEAACHGGALCATAPTPRGPAGAAGPAEGGAKARAPGPAQALSRYGEAFGMAFQVADDLLDVTADSATLGKPWGSDVRAGKRTLLVLATLERADGSDRKRFLDVLGRQDAGDADVREAVEVMRRCGALAHAEAVRDAYAREAADALAALSPSPARAHLAAMNEWARTRGF